MRTLRKTRKCPVGSPFMVTINIGALQITQAIKNLMRFIAVQLTDSNDYLCRFGRNFRAISHKIRFDCSANSLASLHPFSC